MAIEDVRNEHRFALFAEIVCWALAAAAIVGGIWLYLDTATFFGDERGWPNPRFFALPGIVALLFGGIAVGCRRVRKQSKAQLESESDRASLEQTFK